MSRTIRRYRDATRVNHWIVALLFVLAALSGLALFHPAMFTLAALFGGGTWTRVLHPFFGVLMALGFALLFAQVVRDNLWRPRDTAWLRAAPRYVRSGDERAVPPAGKYNGGQKAVFWVFATCLLLLLLTGFVFWQPWFADAFPIPLRRIAVVVHAAAAVLLILAVIVHVYAAIWVEGSMRAMTRGTVSDAWARRHHPIWRDEAVSRNPAAARSGRRARRP